MGCGHCIPHDQLRPVVATPAVTPCSPSCPREAAPPAVAVSDHPTRRGFLPSGPVSVFPSGLLFDIRQGSLKTGGWMLRGLTCSPRGCCRLRAGHIDGASPCGLGFPTARQPHDRWILTWCLRTPKADVSEGQMEAALSFLTQLQKSLWSKDFPGGPMANTPHFQCMGPGFDPWSGN